eukprot:superscaffoldBa00000142_g2060
MSGDRPHRGFPYLDQRGSPSASGAAFLCLKNIRTFLKVCHDKFGLRNSELFDPFDLFDVRDFGKLLEKELDDREGIRDWLVIHDPYLVGFSYSFRK